MDWCLLLIEYVFSKSINWISHGITDFAINTGSKFDNKPFWFWSDRYHVSMSKHLPYCFFSIRYIAIYVTGIKSLFLQWFLRNSQSYNVPAFFIYPFFLTSDFPHCWYCEAMAVYFKSENPSLIQDLSWICFTINSFKTFLNKIMFFMTLERPW